MNSNSDKEISFQPRVADWLNDCFGQEIAADVIERNHRFLEEALELVQACNCSADEAHKLVDYVFGRDVGDKPQEVGGVLVTLAALCAAQGVDMHQAGEVELARISQPETVVRIREKQKRKPAMSPLPGSQCHQPKLQPCPRQAPRSSQPPWPSGDDQASAAQSGGLAGLAVM